MASGVYEIEDTINGRVYVGSSMDMVARLKRHRTMLNSGTHFCRHLQNAYTLRGADAFIFRMVVETSIDEMRTVEESVIRSYPADQLYNRIMSPIKGVMGLRWTMSEETKRKIGAANKGRGRPQSLEARAKISVGLSGRPVSEETREKLRMAMQSYPDSARQKISESKKGKPSKLRGRVLSEETRRKISAANLGQRRSSGVRANISAAQRGRVHGPHTEETRQRISAAKIGRPSHPQSEETRAKMSAAQKEAWRRRKERMA